MNSHPLEQKYKTVTLGCSSMKAMIPNDWNIESIDDCCEILDNLRCPVNQQERAEKKGDIPYYGANGVLDHVNDYLFNENLILLAEDGGYFDEYQTRPIAYRITGKSWVNNHAHVLRVRPGHDFDWVFYNLVHRNLIPLINGTTRSKLNGSELRMIKIQFPPLSQQRKAASLLSKVDDVIQKTEEIIVRTQWLKKGLLQTLLTRGIGHTEFKLVQLGPRFPRATIPVDWTLERLTNIARVIDSRHFTPEYTKDGFPLILPNNVKASGLDLKNTKFTNEKDYLDLIAGDRNPSAGDIVYSRNASFGVGCKVEEGARFSLGQDLVLIKPQNIEPSLLHLILNSRLVLSQLARLNTGSTFKRINVDLIRDFLIPYPPDTVEQKRISSIINSLDNQINAYVNYLQSVQDLKKGLMQKLLTGKIRVKV